MDYSLRVLGFGLLFNFPSIDLVGFQTLNTSHMVVVACGFCMSYCTACSCQTLREIIHRTTSMICTPYLYINLINHIYNHVINYNLKTHIYTVSRPMGRSDSGPKTTYPCQHVILPIIYDFMSCVCCESWFNHLFLISQVGLAWTTIFI